jgi:hypothetical protein
VSQDPHVDDCGTHPESCDCPRCKAVGETAAELAIALRLARDAHAALPVDEEADAAVAAAIAKHGMSSRKLKPKP